MNKATPGRGKRKCKDAEGSMSGMLAKKREKVSDAERFWFRSNMRMRLEREQVTQASISHSKDSVVHLKGNKHESENLKNSPGNCVG